MGIRTGNGGNARSYRALGRRAAAPAIAALLAAVAAPAGSAGQGGLELEVDLSERELYVRVDGELLNTYPVAIGQPEHPTPRGNHEISRVIWNPAWVPPETGWAEHSEPRDPGDPDNPMGKVKLFFDPPAYFIHGTDDTDTLGDPASHGCLRMRNTDAMDLARRVMEHGGAHRPDSWYEEVIYNDTLTREVDIPNPVPLRIHG